MEDSEVLFHFRRYLMDEDINQVERHCEAAIEKLQTLFPGKKLTKYDTFTLAIETDSYYSETGIDLYELGLVDNEIPAMRNTNTGDIFTLRL